jgi:hypothetical protein
MKNQDYTKDLEQIRAMMQKSSKFLLLSGWSGIMAGLYATAGIFAAYLMLRDQGVATFAQSTQKLQLVLIAFAVLFLTLVTAAMLAHRKAKKNNEILWGVTAQKLVSNIAVPLFAGGFLILILLAQSNFDLIPALTLIFYGLSLYSGGRDTYHELRSLGLLELSLGIAAAYFIEYQLLLLLLGFGFLHIVYGVYVYYKYEK